MVRIINKVIGIAAHVDAGKTTLSEALMYHSSTIKTKGRVDHQNSHLDIHPLEKKRGITIFTDQAILNYKGDKYFLLDTPGHVDFSPEMERTLKVLDYLIIVVSAVEGIEGHTETVWELAKELSLPVFFFINKCDRQGADAEGVITELKENFSENIYLYNKDLESKLEEGFVEFLAERNEKLLNSYVNNNIDQKVFKRKMKEMLKNRNLFFAASGSALNDEGVIEFFNNLHRLTQSNYDKQKRASARLFKITHDDQGNKISHLKIRAGIIKIRDELDYNNSDKKIEEKISEIRYYNGSDYKTAVEAEAGEIIGVRGLSAAEIGTGFGELENLANYNFKSVLKSRVIYDDDINVRELIKVFQILNDEDPSLNVSWDSSRKELQVNVMGTVQLEILKTLVAERFGFEIDFASPSIIYKESIDDQVCGYGHFEPLKHYAEVHLKIESAPRNSGIIFKNNASTDDLSVGVQNLVKQHLLEKEHPGLLTGSSLTDLKITLLRGRAHNKHTSGGDFKEATLRALRQGLEKTDNILLEPIYRFKIIVNTDHLGREEIIEEKNYDKNKDPEYSSNSIFCEKGKGYTVSWKEAENEMHLL